MLPGPAACLSGADDGGVLSLDSSAFEVGFAGVEAGVTLRGSAEDGGMVIDVEARIKGCSLRAEYGKLLARR